MSITKSQLAEEIWNQGKGTFSKAESVAYLEAVLEEMKRAIVEKGELKISGFGSFTVKQKNNRIGRNPQTGVPLLIVGRRIVNFKVSPVLKKAMK